MRRDGAATVVAFEGDADIVGVTPLRDALARVVAEEEGPVVIDLTHTHFIDSSGISVLLNALRRLTRQGRRMAVVADTKDVVRPLEIAGLEETLRMHRSLDAALVRVGAA